MLLDSQIIIKREKKWIRQKWFTLYSHPKFVHSLSLGDNNRNEFKKKWKHSLSFSLFPNDTERTHLKTGKTNLHEVALSSVVSNLVDKSWKETLEQTADRQRTLHQSDVLFYLRTSSKKHLWLLKVIGCVTCGIIFRNSCSNFLNPP